MKKLTLLIILSTIFTFLIHCNSGKRTEKENVLLANPATVNCLKLGGKLKIVSTKSGEYGVCLFNDGSTCEEWSLFRNKCKAGDCKTECKFAGTDKEGWYDCNGKLIYFDKCSSSIK